MDCTAGRATNTDFEKSPLGCVDCSGFTTAAVIIVPIVVFILCVGLMRFIDQHPFHVNPLLAEAQNSMGQLIMFTQVINAIFSTRLLFGEPLVGFMGDVMSHLDPDAIFSSSPCLFDGLADPIPQYAIVISAPVAFIVMLSLVYLFGLFALKGIFPVAGLFNVIGEVLVEFYISITLAIFSPFDCFSHPSGDQSVNDYPQILCGDGNHKVMVGLSVFGILAFPVMAIMVSLSATWYFPRALIKNEISHMVRCSFLFERWRPECYWFCNVTIFRNFAIAVLPSVMPEGDLDVTILLMMIVLVVSLVCCVWFKPRRSDTQNALDRFISLVKIIVLSFGIISVHGEAVRYQLLAGCVALGVCVIAWYFH